MDSSQIVDSKEIKTCYLCNGIGRFNREICIACSGSGKMTSKHSVILLRREIKTLEQNLKQKQKYLLTIQSTCRHDFNPVIYAPIRREAYTCPGDPVGTMGIDWRGPLFVPAEVTPRWTRTCKICDLTEETKRITQKTTSVPKFD